MSGLDIQLEKSEYYSPVCKKSVARCKIQQIIYHFFMQLIPIYGLVVKTGCREYDDMGSIPEEC